MVDLCSVMAAGSCWCFCQFPSFFFCFVCERDCVNKLLSSNTQMSQNGVNITSSQHLVFVVEVLSSPFVTRPLSNSKLSSNLHQTTNNFQARCLFAARATCFQGGCFTLMSPSFGLNQFPPTRRQTFVTKPLDHCKQLSPNFCRTANCFFKPNNV